MRGAPAEMLDQAFGAMQVAAGFGAIALFFFAASDGAAPMAMASAAKAPNVRNFPIVVISQLPFRIAELCTTTRWATRIAADMFTAWMTHALCSMVRAPEET